MRLNRFVFIIDGLDNSSIATGGIQKADTITSRTTGDGASFMTLRDDGSTSQGSYNFYMTSSTTSTEYKLTLHAGLSSPGGASHGTADVHYLMVARTED